MVGDELSHYLQSEVYRYEQGVNYARVVSEAVGVLAQVSYLVPDRAVDEEGAEEEAGAIEPPLGATGNGIFIDEELAGAG